MTLKDGLLRKKRRSPSPETRKRLGEAMKRRWADEISRAKLTQVQIYRTIEVFLGMIKKIEDGCWIWQGRIYDNGYGNFGLNKKYTTAHRFSYQHFKGKIPKGKVIDHLCRNKTCVNPEHLEAVSIKENVLRGSGIAAKNAKKTHCKRGHEFTPQNTYSYVKNQGIGRTCRECGRLRYLKLLDP